MSKIFAQVLLPLALDEAFTYLGESDIEIGSVVQVEFGKKIIWGVVESISTKAPTDFLEEKIKKILIKNPLINLTKNHLNFIKIISSYNLAKKGLVLRAFIGILNADKVKKSPKILQQEINYLSFSLKKLSYAQQKIADDINETKKRDQVFLLDGITGSGKTEIYFLLIAKILTKNSSAQILILLPEIALTSQLLVRFEEQFKFKPALWHSKISKKEKREIFYAITDGSLKVLVGARSALLLPFKNLQLIVIDEEHDSSFKQEDVFNFHARDMAVAKGKIENFPVVLSSATPSLESYVNAVVGKYHHFILEQKFGQKNDIELIDLRQEKFESGNFLSQKLRTEITQNFIAKKQTLLFLNRRGYAPVSLCKSCGKKYECANCDFYLVLHKAKKKLICHHCGHQENLLINCKFCGEKDTIIAIGIGVEKLEEELKKFLPHARIAVITSDSVNSFLDADKIVKKILEEKIDVIIGTQMIAKGYDFPNLTLVGIVDADSMLYSSQLRA
jgi:primosomal protein N' (replication factor Y)